MNEERETSYWMGEEDTMEKSYWPYGEEMRRSERMRNVQEYNYGAMKERDWKGWEEERKQEKE